MEPLWIITLSRSIYGILIRRPPWLWPQLTTHGRGTRCGPAIRNTLLGYFAFLEIFFILHVSLPRLQTFETSLLWSLGAHNLLLTQESSYMFPTAIYHLHCKALFIANVYLTIPSFSSLYWYADTASSGSSWFTARNSGPSVWDIELKFPQVTYVARTLWEAERRVYDHPNILPYHRPKGVKRLGLSKLCQSEAVAWRLTLGIQLSYRALHATCRYPSTVYFSRRSHM